MAAPYRLPSNAAVLVCIITVYFGTERLAREDGRGRFAEQRKIDMETFGGAGMARRHQGGRGGYRGGRSQGYQNGPARCTLLGQSYPQMLCLLCLSHVLCTLCLTRPRLSTAPAWFRDRFHPCECSLAEYQRAFVCLAICKCS